MKVEKICAYLCTSPGIFIDVFLMVIMFNFPAGASISIKLFQEIARAGDTYRDQTH
jgi:hypothetical protein